MLNMSRFLFQSGIGLQSRTAVYYKCWWCFFHKTFRGTAEVVSDVNSNLIDVILCVMFFWCVFLRNLFISQRQRSIPDLKIYNVSVGTQYSIVESLLRSTFVCLYTCKTSNTVKTTVTIFHFLFLATTVITWILKRPVDFYLLLLGRKNWWGLKQDVRRCSI